MAGEGIVSGTADSAPRRRVWQARGALLPRPARDLVHGTLPGHHHPQDTVCTPHPAQYLSAGRPACMSSHEKQLYIMSEYNIYNAGNYYCMQVSGCAPLEVCHLHFTGWSGHDSPPTASSLLAFHRRYTEITRTASHPTVVHCRYQH